MGDDIIIELQKLQESKTEGLKEAPHIDQPRKVLALHRHIRSAESQQQFKSSTALLTSDGNAPLIECADSSPSGYSRPCAAMSHMCRYSSYFRQACPATCNACGSLHFEFTGTRKVCRVGTLALLPTCHSLLTLLLWQVACRARRSFLVAVWVASFAASACIRGSLSTFGLVQLITSGHLSLPPSVLLEC